MESQRELAPKPSVNDDSTASSPLQVFPCIATGSSTGSKRNFHTPEEWEDVREFVTTKFWVEKCGRDKVHQLLEARGFRTSNTKLREKILEWKIRRKDHTPNCETRPKAENRERTRSEGNSSVGPDQESYSGQHRRSSRIRGSDNAHKHGLDDLLVGAHPGSSYRVPLPPSARSESIPVFADSPPERPIGPYRSNHEIYLPAPLHEATTDHSERHRLLSIRGCHSTIGSALDTVSEAKGGHQLTANDLCEDTLLSEDEAEAPTPRSSENDESDSDYDGPEQDFDTAVNKVNARSVYSECPRPNRPPPCPPTGD